MDNRQAKNFLKIIKKAANKHNEEFSKKLVQFFEAHVKKPRRNISRKRALHDPNVMIRIMENEGFTPAMRETALRAAVATIWDEIETDFTGSPLSRNKTLKELERTFRNMNVPAVSSRSPATRKNKRSLTH